MSDLASARSAGEFDLRPDPRVLPMLGEINLEPWRCIAELIDNAVDGFLHALRGGGTIDGPEVIVQLPTVASPQARVVVRDNGPGMSPEMLEQAVRAGWTGNNPIDNLGLFGMGFNIATARLGLVTRVWTTRAGASEWHGVAIDFDELRRRRSFRTPHLIRPKASAGEHGTEVTIERLKPEQLQTMARTASQSRIRDQLAKSYSAILRPDGTPISFGLELNGRSIPARSHCVWGENRSVTLPSLGEVPAILPFNVVLPSRQYCLSCMRWLGTDETSCSTPTCQVVSRERRVHGWVGLQRYLSDSDFGLDFIRNGRKIEFGVKELFEWQGDGGAEPEYPIDDPRKRGRFVGEIHLDHCRVHYDKTLFERTDPAWAEMVRVVRGEGPLRPEKAAQLGYAQNLSPLYRLYQAFRRSMPRERGGTGWTTRMLVVKDNDRAQEMARYFHENRQEYLDDAKWWELVQAEELNAFRGGGQGAGGNPGVPPGFVDADDDPPAPPQQPPNAGRGPAAPAPPPAPPAPPPRERLPDLSRRYEVTGGGQTNVEAFAVGRTDPALAGRPWRFELGTTATRIYHFLVDPGHTTFRSASFSPRDALLAEIARHVAEFTRGGGAPVSFEAALTDLRSRYAASDELDPTQIIRDAELALAEVARSVRGRLDEETCAALFAELPADEQQGVFRRMAHRGVTTPAALVADGGFVEFLDRHALRRFFERHPELFLDGRFWEDPYSALDFGDAMSTALAQRRAVERYSSLLADAVWTADLDPTDLAHRGREELVRASISIHLLRPDVGED